MSLFNIGEQLAAARLLAQEAESELEQVQDLVCAWFGDSDVGAREWLIAIKDEHYARYRKRRLFAASDTESASHTGSAQS